MAIEIKEPTNERPFPFIDPPFNFNAPGVSKFAPEITGIFLCKAYALDWVGMTYPTNFCLILGAAFVLHERLSISQLKSGFMSAST